MYTPGWARPSGTSATYGPDPAKYAAFAKVAAAHYSALGVHAYEVWNEPNMKSFWTPSPNVGDYTRLLKAAYPAIKGADPQATVLTGGTAPAPDDGTSYSPVTFLKGIYANGGGNSFDAVSHHPYCWPAFPGDPEAWSAWYQMYGTSPSLRSLMTSNGDGGKKIWATEFGAPTDGPAGSFVSESRAGKDDHQGVLHLAHLRLGRTAVHLPGPRPRNEQRHAREPLRPAPQRLVAEARLRRLQAGGGGGDRQTTPTDPPTTDPPTTDPTTPPATTTTTVTVKKKGKGPATMRRSAVTGEVSPKATTSTKLSGRVSLRVYRRDHGKWRMASHKQTAAVGPNGGFRTRLGRFGHRVQRPGTYRVRARYLGGQATKPSASRYRKFKLRSTHS